MNLTRLSFAGLGAAALALAAFATTRSSAEGAHATPAPAVDEPLAKSSGKETIVLAGGCFWGVQGVFQHVKGVTNAVSGYAGGDKDTARIRDGQRRPDGPRGIGARHL